MSISRDLTVIVTNEEEGVTLTLKTVSSLGKDKVFISGDPSVHDIKEIEEALKNIQEFSREAEEKQVQFNLISQAVASKEDQETPV